MLTIHKPSFMRFGVVLAVHFLAYAPSVVRSLRSAWGAARRHGVPGAGARDAVAAAVGRGAALALLPTIHAYAGQGWVHPSRGINRLTAAAAIAAHRSVTRSIHD